MRHWKVLMLALVAVALPNCAQEAGQLSTSGSPSRTYVINASAKSCITKRTEDSSNPSPNDVGAAFFQVQYLNVSWPNTQKTLIVASIRLKFQGGQFSGGNYVCEFAGDNLLALNDTWWSKGEAAVGGPEIASYKAPTDAAQRYTPAQTVPITCPIVCGGLSASTAFQASGVIDIIGFSRDTNGELTPERTTGFISIESLGD
ncbi:hypothetical protein AB1A81_03985 [Bdellovibrio bacteriovorus]|uniref:Uncharacterized protein n=1 Tax=Bdellovibrio bacteriovorus (strain ATCC 15356 / DSM 50701 / NCIMB 9529 / HD100) TaxID=264462 RepID=Q6MPI5_BDEBA|nr:hypothetical protein [Bdellovibrio bacteriovorus]CAE78813.1 hypothetical protein predicted by Glimmer/Critica [Bdellovibrio bacteriovorus HD100]